MTSTFAFFFPCGEMAQCPVVHGTCYCAALMGLFVRTCDALWWWRHACPVVQSSLFVTRWTVVLYTPLSVGFFQTRILECIASSPFRETSQPRDQACISCITYIAGRVVTAEPSGKPLVVDICTLKVH